jgi:hypothetical protein
LKSFLEAHHPTSASLSHVADFVWRYLLALLDIPYSCVLCGIARYTLLLFGTLVWLVGVLGRHLAVLETLDVGL